MCRQKFETVHSMLVLHFVVVVGNIFLFSARRQNRIPSIAQKQRTVFGSLLWFVRGHFGTWDSWYLCIQFGGRIRDDHYNVSWSYHCVLSIYMVFRATESEMNVYHFETSSETRWKLFLEQEEVFEEVQRPLKKCTINSKEDVSGVRFFSWSYSFCLCSSEYNSLVKLHLSFSEIPLDAQSPSRSEKIENFVFGPNSTLLKLFYCRLFDVRASLSAYRRRVKQIMCTPQKSLLEWMVLSPLE